MSDVRNNLVPTNIQELFLPLSRIHSYGTRSSTSQKFYIKKLKLEMHKNSFSRLGAKLWNEIPTMLCTLSKHKCKFNIRASLLDTLETVDTYYEIDEIINYNPAHKNSELMFCFLFRLRVLNAFFHVFFFVRLL